MSQDSVPAAVVQVNQARQPSHSKRILVVVVELSADWRTAVESRDLFDNGGGGGRVECKWRRGVETSPPSTYVEDVGRRGESEKCACSS